LSRSLLSLSPWWWWLLLPDLLAGGEGSGFAGLAVGTTAALLPIQEIAELTNIGTLFAFVLVCRGVWLMLQIEPDLRRPFHTPLVPLVPILGVVFCTYLMASLPRVTWLRFFIWMAAGLAIYFAYGRFHSRVAADAAEQARASAS